MTKKWHIWVRFLWYDFWVGFYYDRSVGSLYICPLPCVVIKIAHNYGIM